jgi:hypothetical protein
MALEMKRPQDSISSLYRDMMQYAYDIQDGKKEIDPEDLTSAMQSFGERMAILVYMAEKRGNSTHYKK